MIFSRASEVINRSFKEGPKSITGISTPSDFLPPFNDYFTEEMDNHLIILPDEPSCQTFSKALERPHHLLLDPSPQPYSDLLFSNNVMLERLKCFHLALNKTGQIFISHPAALALLTINPSEFKSSTVKFEYADSFFEKPTEQLMSMGYLPTPFVEKPGQFSEKGGIIDVFSPSEKHPVRISLFGDEIESIHHYSVKNQRNISELDSFMLSPASEFFYSNDSSQKDLLGAIHQATISDHEWKTKSLEAIRNKKPFDKMHLFSHLLWKDHKPTWSFFDPNKTKVICFDYKECEKIYAQYQKDCLTDFESLEENSFKNLCPPNLLSKNDFDFSNYSFLIDVIPVLIEDISLNNSTGFIKNSEEYPVHSLSNTLKYNKSKSSKWEDYAKETKKLISQLSSDYNIIISSSGSSSLKKCESFLNEYDIKFTSLESLDKALFDDEVNVYTVLDKNKISAKYDSDKIVLINNDELFGSPKSRQSKSASSTQFFDSLDLLQMSDLSIDDLVVHRNHGVGSYKGLKILTLNGVESECLEIEYSNKDKLFLPVYSINHIKKYGDSKSSRSLDKLGGIAWQKLKSKAQKKLNDIAQDLVALYAKRKSLLRKPIPSDTSEYSLFESQFPFQETEDQLKAIEDIQEDLGKDHVMDRLICGDVGFGKTEVAMRAAFHYLLEGKQVAVMAPTTVLSMQHYQSFKNRFKSWPFQIDVLNRFVSKNKISETTEKLKIGRAHV